MRPRTLNRIDGRNRIDRRDRLDGRRRSSLSHLLNPWHPWHRWFTAIQSIESKENLAGLPPKGCFVSAEAVERIVGQIRQTQKATRNVSGGKSDHFR